METYFDSHLDLLQRRLAKTSDRLKSRAEERLKDIKKDMLKKDGVLKIVGPTNAQLERELQRYKLKVRTCAASVPCLSEYRSLRSRRSPSACSQSLRHGTPPKSSVQERKSRSSLVSCPSLSLLCCSGWPQSTCFTSVVVRLESQGSNCAVGSMSRTR